MTASVYSTLTDPSGNPVVNAVVVATLMGPTILIGSSVEREVQVFTDQFGEWVMPLIPNNVFSDNNLDSWYLIRVGNKEEYRVYVPQDQNSYEVSTIAYPGLQITNKSVFIGNMYFQGDTFIQGDLNVSGKIECSTFQQITSISVPPGTKTTFFNDLQIIGDLKVDGILRYFSVSGTTPTDPGL